MLHNHTRLIGLVNRAGRFSPSNETSEQRYREVMVPVLKRYGMSEADLSPTLTYREVELFKDHAKAAGFKVVTISRGITR